MSYFCYAVFFGVVLVLPPPSDKPPSMEIVEKVLDAGVAQAGLIAPSILVDIAKNESVMRKLASWDFVSYGGAPLPDSASNKLWDYCRLIVDIGSTETFMLAEFAANKKEEALSHSFHPCLGFEMRHRYEDQYELVFVRQEQYKRWQGAFQTFPDLQEYGMSDLYSEDPKAPGRWLYRGRTDDIVVLSNGEKISPQEMEALITTQNGVNGSLVIGNGRFRPALLVEPSIATADDEAKKQMIDQLWNVVQEANKLVPGYAQIDRAHIGILDGPYTFERSGKGVIKRKTSIDELSAFVDKLYKDAEENVVAFDLEFGSADALRTTLLANVQREFEKLRGIDADNDIFQRGFDSLQVLQMTRSLKGSIENWTGKPAEGLKANFVYEHNSVDSMVEPLLSAARGHVVESSISASHEELQDLLEIHTAPASVASLTPPSTPPRRFTIVLTGSTGNLGSYILDSLIRNSSVSHIHCLNRSKSEQRHHQLFADRGLPPNFEKVTFHRADLASPMFGLSEPSYRAISAEATHLIHNAWPVDFNKSIRSFTSQLSGCQRLTEFAVQSRFRPHIFFVSSIGTANSWAVSTQERVPEGLLMDWDAAEPMGYTQSKLAAERIFARATETLGISATLCRVGQIAGPVLREEGVWNQREWFPSLIASSQYLGKIPQSLGAMDRVEWIPVDELADAIVEMTTRKGMTESLRVINTVNPTTASWSDLLPSVCAALGNSVQAVPLEVWIAAVETLDSPEDIEANPAIKLVEFYRSLMDVSHPGFQTEKAQEMSPTLSQMSPVNASWLTAWMEQWTRSGMLKDVERREADEIVTAVSNKRKLDCEADGQRRLQLKA